MTENGETVCEHCGMVAAQGAPEMDISAPKSSVITCDENRLGGQAINSPAAKHLGKLNYREKPLRKKFNDACLAMGMHSDSIRNALYYFDSLHTIRDNLKKDSKKEEAMIEILGKNNGNTKIAITEMENMPYWKTGTAHKWLETKFDTDRLPDKLEQVEFKSDRPKKLSTINIAFYSAYAVTCKSANSNTRKKIIREIQEHMGFKRDLKVESAITACQYALRTYKGVKVEIDSSRNDLMLATRGLPEKARRHVYKTFNSLPKEKQKHKLLQAIVSQVSEMQQMVEVAP